MADVEDSPVQARRCKCLAPDYPRLYKQGARGLRR